MLEVGIEIERYESHETHEPHSGLLNGDWLNKPGTWRH